jgi:hypothetical protein
MVLVGHERHLQRRLTRRERRVTLSVAGGLVALIAAICIFVTVHGDTFSSSHDGCVNVVVPSTLGGAFLHKCGGQAQSWCRSEVGHTDKLARLVLTQCRKAGIDV